MQGYIATPDFYNSFIAHRDHKYISKHKGKDGRWVYVYKQPKMSDLPNPYTEMNEGMNNLRTGAKKLAIGGLRGALNANNRFNQYMNKKAASAGKAVAGEASRRYNSAKGRATAEYNKKSAAVKKNANSVYNTAAGTYNSAASAVGKKAGAVKDAYDENRKKRRAVAAGKKNIKKHNINKRVQKRVESDNAVYVRALKNARETVKRRKQK